MIIVDAFWEKRNLGKSSVEINIEKSDSVDDLRQLNNIEANYQVIKLPTSRVDLVLSVQSFGFKFVEMMYSCRHDLAVPTLSSPLARMALAFTYTDATDTDVEIIREHIYEGMFETDRVAIDPAFGINKAATRYLGWMDDLIKQSAKVIILRYRNKPVGFFVLKLSGIRCDALIGGIFKEKIGAGFGFMLNYFEIIYAKELGCNELWGAFSSNNGPVFGINTQLGYKICPSHYVFVKHNNKVD